MDKIGSRNKGIILIIISAFGFAMMSAFVKLAGDLPSFQKTFFRNLVSCFVAMFFIIKHKQSFFGKKENQKILITRSTFGTLGIIFNFYAIDKLVLSDANMLNKLSPFLVIIFSALFLKEKINLRQLISIIIAFIGALFIIRPEFNMAVMPAIVGVLGAVCAAADDSGTGCGTILLHNGKFYRRNWFHAAGTRIGHSGRGESRGKSAGKKSAGFLWKVSSQACGADFHVGFPWAGLDDKHLAL